MATRGSVPHPLGKVPPPGVPPPVWEAGLRLPLKANPWGFAHDPAMDENTGKADVVLVAPKVPFGPLVRPSPYFQNMWWVECAYQAGLEMRGLLP